MASLLQNAKCISCQESLTAIGGTCEHCSAPDVTARLEGCAIDHFVPSSDAHSAVSTNEAHDTAEKSQRSDTTVAEGRALDLNPDGSEKEWRYTVVDPAQV
jgi:hypothetical protein